MSAEKNVWTYINAVSHSKDMSLLDDGELESLYLPFIVNKSLSHFEDAVLAANAMNERPGLDKKLQALFLINTLRPRKRFSKWMKAEEVSDDVRNVAEYYGCSQRYAVALVPLHSPEQMTHIQHRLQKGGADKKRVAK